MKVIVLYRPASEHARAVESYLHDFQARNNHIAVELVNVDDREGIALANVYDITRYPAILAMAPDGGVLNMWQGEELPLMNEVASYAHSSI